MNASPSKFSIAAVIIFGIFAVSTSSIFIRYAQSDNVNSMLISTARLVIASLALLPVVIYRYRDDLQKLPKSGWLLALASGIFLALHFFSWITSLEYTTITSSVVLVTTTPLWVALLSPFLLREKGTTWLVLGMVVALAGGIVIGVSDLCYWENGLTCPIGADFWADNSLFGNFLALVGAWMAAGYIMIGRQLRSSLPLIPYIFLVYGLAAIFSTCVVLFLGLKIIGYANITYIWLILLGLVPQLFGHSSFNWALKYVKASMVSIMLLGEPIGSSILGFIVFRETPTLLTVVGGILILGGILVATYQPPSSDQQKQ